MGSEWESSTLEDAGVILLDCVHKTPVDAGSGIPYIAIPQIKNGCINFSANPRLISTSDYEKWTIKAKPQADDIVLSRRCNPGETAYVPEGREFALGQNLVLLRSSCEKVYPPFLRWLVRGPEWWEQVSKFLNVGAVFDSLRCGDIPNFELLLPPPSEQKAIAHILGSLDDKIELNRQMNETLESMAQALFKSWFVDFDPVIDNVLAKGNDIPEILHSRAEVRRLMDDKFKHHSQEILKQFPSSFIFDDEMGCVPEGWRVGSLLDYAELISGGTPKTSNNDYWDGDVPWVSAKDVSQCSDAILGQPERYITNIGLENSSTKLVGKYSTVIVSRGATTGRLAMVGGDFAMNQTCYALRSKFQGHFYQYCKTKDVISSLVNAAHGSIFDTITTTTFRSTSVLLPPVELAMQFDKLASAYFSRLHKSLEESSVLIKLRDTLLPKLLSGELRIPNAEKLIDEIEA